MKNRGPLDTSKKIVINDLEFELGEILSVVNKFYTKVKNDRMLREPFSSVSNWSKHIDHITHFWWVRFGGEKYLDLTYNPIKKHFEAGFNDIFLERWIELFSETARDILEEKKAMFWIDLVKKMGSFLSSRNEELKKLHQE